MKRKIIIKNISSINISYDDDDDESIQLLIALNKSREKVRERKIRE